MLSFAINNFVKLIKKKMRKKNVTIALTAFLMFAGVSSVTAQETTPTEKKPFGVWLTKTPWIVGFGGEIIDDNNSSKIFRSLTKYTYYPAKFTAEKVLKKGWSAQFAFASTSLNPHNYLGIDLNGKYDFNNLIGDTKWFDPFAVLGLGYTYRDLTPLASNDDPKSSSNLVNFNAGLGANLWIFPNVAITGQGLAKFTKNNYLQASLGLSFRIGNCPTNKCEATPKTKEAEDALQHLRGIINK